MTRYVIVGAGGIGVTFAAELQRAGREVVLVSRGAQLAALRDGKVRYSRPDGTRQLDLPPSATPARSSSGPVTCSCSPPRRKTSSQ